MTRIHLAGLQDHLAGILSFPLLESDPKDRKSKTLQRGQYRRTLESQPKMKWAHNNTR